MIFENFIVCLVLIFIALCTSVVPLIVGKARLKRALKPLEFYPPDGYSPIDVLIKYYGHKADPHALFNPLMLYWADKNYITVQEDCKRGFILTKLKDLEPNYVGYDGKNNFAAEKKLFNSMFDKTDVFYTLAATSDANKNYNEFAKSVKDNAKDMRSPAAKKASLASMVASMAVLVIVTIIVGMEVGMTIMTMLFPCIGIIALRFFPNEGIFTYFKYFFFGVWGGAPLCVAVFLSPPLAGTVLFLATAVAALNFMVLAARIDLRKKEDVEIYGRLIAFKTFLLEVEIDKLELLLEENPNYYFDILPFCYIFKITEKMKIKFDKIDLDGPAWYLGDMRNRLMF